MHVNEHEHDLDPEFLHPTDVAVLAVFDDDGDLSIRFAIPCPECGESVEVVARGHTVEESDLELPLDDVEEIYD